MVKGAFRRLSPRLRSLLERYGYVEPTPVQERAIPVILRGANTLVIAPTGSGKTEAALFPIFSRIIEEGLTGLVAVYVTPLRSLNRDIFARMARMAGELGIDMMVRHGDSSESEKRRFLEAPPNIMVTTPETLYFMLSVPRFRSMLRTLRFVVVDEVHELLDDKRGTELALALERLEEYSGRRLQRIGLSATVRDPRAAAEFLAYGRLVEIVDVSWLERRMKIVVEAPLPSSLDEAEAKRLGVENPATVARLRRIVELAGEARGGVIVFTNTRDTAEVIGALLSKLMGEDSVLVHHGSLSRDERLRAERLFREGRVKVIVATSSLELGIDIGHVDLVVQYMSPRQALKLVQRVGRSRHRLGAVSQGVIIASDNVFDILESSVLAARAARGDLEPQEPYPKPYDALVHQLVGAVLEKQELSVERFYWLLQRTLMYSGMGFDEYSAVVEYARAVGVIRVGDGGVAQPGRRAKTYYYSVTMIPDTEQYPVIETASRRRIGVLDAEFVASLEEGSVFVLAGRVWQVVAVEEDAVYVKPAEASELLPPAWEGDLIPVDWRAAREVGSILRRYERMREEVLKQYPLAEPAIKYLKRVLDSQLSQVGVLPSDRRVYIESLGETVVVYAFLGTKGAKALELALSMIARQLKGYTPRTASTPYCVILSFSSHTPAAQVSEMMRLLARLPEEEVKELVHEGARRTRLFEWKLYHVALRMGAVEKKAKPDRRLLQRLADTIVGREALKELLHDKVDLEPLIRLLRDIASGRVEVVAVDRAKPTPLTEHVIGEARLGDRVAEALPATILADVVKRRLAKRRLRLVCLRCGNVWEKSLSELDNPACPECGARYIAPTRLEAREARELVRKVWSRQKLRRSERKLYNELAAAADLVLTYGRRALEALAATGVGPSTAKQVLRKLVFGEEAFYKALVEAEQRYLRTRKYWK